jgi:hypothetical protein
MKRANRLAVVLIAFAGLSLTACGPGPFFVTRSAGTAQEGSLERPFVAGGQVRMNLSAGDYRIEAGREDRILVRWDTRSSTPR